MYKCESCGHLFEEGEAGVLVESHEHFGTPCEERFYVCPICDGNYHEVKPCKICGGYTQEENEEFCEECRKKTIKAFMQLWNQFEDAEKEFLKEQIYEEELL